LEKRIDKILGVKLLKELEKMYNKGNINNQTYQLIKEDIDWLLNY